MSAPQPVADEDPVRSTARVRLLFLICIAAGAAVRVAAACGDFWLDEIWSWELARRQSSLLDIVLRLPDENNHFLNTMWLYFIGPGQGWLICRLPNVLAGVGSVVLAGLIARRDGTAAAVASMALVAGSYLLIHYSSEARGYGLVVFFSLLACHTLSLARERPTLGRELAFGAACVLGFLSQPVFVYAYGSLALWWLWGAVQALRSEPVATPAAQPRVRGSRRSMNDVRATHPTGERRLATLVVDGLRCHAIPLAFLVWFYFTILRRMVNSGGPVIPLYEVVAQTLSLAVGGPWGGWPAMVAAGGVAVIAVAGVIGLFRSADDRWVLYASVLCLMPTGLMLATGRHEVYPRYFTIAVAFLCLLLGRLAGLAWDSGRRGRTMAALFVLAILIGNGMHTARLLRLGRGGYLAALDFMQQETSVDKLTIGSDHDFRNAMVLSYYSQYRREGSEWEYFPQDTWGRQSPEWFLTHDLDPEARPPGSVELLGTNYRLQRDYPYAGLSGWSWAVYRK